MKNFFSSKKNFVTITVLFFIIIFTVLFYFCLINSNVTKENPIAASNNSDFKAPTSDGTNNDIMPLASATSPNAYISYSTAKNESHITSIISSRYVKTKINSIEVSEYAYFFSPNLKQSTYNNKLYSYQHSKVDGTCTLIAITIAKKVVEQIVDDLVIEYPNETSTYDNTFFTFKELYEISKNKFGNFYPSSGATGTKHETIPKIMTEYYSQNGIDLDVTDIYRKGNVREYMYQNNDIYAPMILSIQGYYDDQYAQYSSGAHSVVCLGAYIYKVNYKSYSSKFDLIGKKHEEKFPVFVICNGWTNADDSSFGNNFQFLIFTDNCEFVHINNYLNWITYEK